MAVTDHPDVQRLIAKNVELRADTKQLETYLDDERAENKKLQTENKRLRKHSTISPFQKELALQCIDFVKNSPRGYKAIPLGYNLEEDIGIINQAEQALKETNAQDS